MLSYGRLTIDFGIVVFAKMRWLFSYGVTFGGLPQGKGFTNVLPTMLENAPLQVSTVDNGKLNDEEMLMFAALCL